MGAGSAGCVLANRLSANGQFTVLVLEAGGEEINKPEMDVPSSCGSNACDPAHVWGDMTAPQQFSVGFDNHVGLARLTVGGRVTTVMR